MSGDCAEGREVTLVMRGPERIAIDLTPVLPGGHNGGAKVFALALIRQLARLHPECQFVLLTQGASHEELAVLDGPNVRRHLVLDTRAAPAGAVPRASVLARLARRLPGRVHRRAVSLAVRMRSQWRRRTRPALLRQLGADLLYCPFTAPTYFEAGIPVVATVHDLQYRTYPQFFTVQDNASRDLNFRMACERATLIAADSDYSRDVAIRAGGLDESRIRTVHLRLAHRIILPAHADESVLARLGLAAGRYLIYPANFWLHKNHEMLLTAFGIACANGLPADTCLVCTGAPGDRQAWLAQAAQAMGLAGRVVFPGYVPEAEMSVLMQRSAGMVFPSLYEGFGLPVLEAMAAGVAVACSNRTSLPEVAGNAALQFDPRIPQQIAAGMHTLLCDPARRAELVERGRVQSAPYADSERMAREYWDLFLQALQPDALRDSLAGAWPDGWMGTHLQLQTSGQQLAGTLRMEVHAPDWLPFQDFTLRVAAAGSQLGEPTRIRRGSTRVLEVLLPDRAGLVDVEVAPAFVPASLGISPDQRELTLMLLSCSIQRARGPAITLLAKASAA